MPMPTADILNQRFGRLVVKEKTQKRYYRSVVWLCQCDCGTFCEVNTTYLRRGIVWACKKCQTSYKRAKRETNYRTDNPKYTIMNRSKTKIILGVNGWLIYFEKQIAERIAIQKGGIVVDLKEAEKIVSNIHSD